MNAAPAAFSVTALDGLPEVAAGADLAALLCAALDSGGHTLRADDVLVVAQKIVSKAEGRRVRLVDVVPSQSARDLAVRTGKDPRVVELVLRESREVLRVGRDVIVVEDIRGLVLANAGVDQSNVGAHEDTAEALLLPLDPDASAAGLRAALHSRTSVAPAVIIADSLGRAWRLGTTGHAIGVTGLPALVDLRGRVDRDGRRLQHSEIGLADSVAAAALLVMGEADEGRPAALVRGLGRLAEGAAGTGARALLRPRERDLFR